MPGSGAWEKNSEQKEQQQLQHRQQLQQHRQRLLQKDREDERALLSTADSGGSSEYGALDDAETGLLARQRGPTATMSRYSPQHSPELKGLHSDNDHITEHPSESHTLFDSAPGFLDTGAAHPSRSHEIVVAENAKAEEELGQRGICDYDEGDISGDGAELPEGSSMRAAASSPRLPGRVYDVSDMASSNSTEPLPFGYDRATVEETHTAKRICCHVPAFVILCILLTAMSSVLLGYDIGIMSAAKLQIKEDMTLSDNQVEVMVGILNFISAFGGLASGKLCDWIGRKATVAVASLVFLAGALLMALAKTYAVLVLGRVITGLGVGCGLTIAPLYMAELSPAKLRGGLVSMNEVSINVGILSGFVAGWGLSSLPDNLGWRWMLGLGAVPPAIILGTLPFLPESPRWLIKHERPEEAFKVLLRSCSPQEAHNTYRDLSSEAHLKQEGTLRDFLCPDHTTFRLVLAGIGVAFFQQATGLEALLYYVPEVLDDAGISDQNDQLLANAGIGAVKVAFILVAMRYSDRYGRKRLLTVSSVGMLFADVFVAISYLLGDISGLTIAGICMYMASFSMGWGPVTWVVTSEIFPLKVRGLAAGTATFVNRITSGTIAMTFLSMSKALTGAGAFFLFASVGLLSIVFVKFLVPETHNKTLEEIEQSARKRRVPLPCSSCCPCCAPPPEESAYLKFANEGEPEKSNA